MRATERRDWKTEPMPDRHTTVYLDRSYSERELRRIQRGFLPEQMEDKWFLYWEDDALFCHRSWTGYCELNRPGFSGDLLT